MPIGKQRMALVTVSFMVVVFALVGRLVGGEEKREETYGDLDTFTEVLHLVNTSYVDPVGDDDLMIGAFRGMLANLDPKSGWLSPDEVRALDDSTPRLFSGVETTKRSGYAYVVAIHAGSPAAKAGVEAGEYIRTVDGVSTREMSVFQLRRALSGAATARMRLNLFGDGQGREVELRLEAWEGEPVQVDTRSGGITVVRLRSVSPVAVQALREALKGLPDTTQQVLLDLRNTVSGERENAVAMADLFLDAGTILHIEERGHERETIEATPERAWAGRLSVLVNRLSSGGAEIVTAALQKNGRARILGEPTFGDASMQRLIRLPDDSALILSVGRFAGPDGDSWGGEGLAPDVVIARDSPGETTPGDAQLDQALEYMAEHPALESAA